MSHIRTLGNMWVSSKGGSFEAVAASTDLLSRVQKAFGSVRPREKAMNPLGNSKKKKVVRPLRLFDSSQQAHFARRAVTRGVKIVTSVRQRNDMYVLSDRAMRLAVTKRLVVVT